MSYLRGQRQRTKTRRMRAFGHRKVRRHLINKKRARLQLLGAGHIPGDDLLSQDLSSHYHRRCGVSLPGSEWDRVVPTALWSPEGNFRGRFSCFWNYDSGDLSYVLG